MTHITEPSIKRHPIDQCHDPSGNQALNSFKRRQGQELNSLLNVRKQLRTFKTPANKGSCHSSIKHRLTVHEVKNIDLFDATFDDVADDRQGK